MTRSNDLLLESVPVGLGAELVFEFGPFILHPARRSLFKGDERVPLGSRAFDLLVALLESGGKVLSSEVLTQKVWPGIAVDDANLRVQIGTLRKVLARYGLMRAVETVPLQGYCLIIPARRGFTGGQFGKASDAGDNLPAQVSAIFGRTQVVETLVSSLSNRRLTTVVGTAGIGKSTVAVAAARQARELFPDGVYYVDFSPLTDPALVPTALAAALELSVLSGDAISGLHARLDAREILVVLDTCEHVVDAVARLVDSLLSKLPRLKILATSREALRVDGEWIQYLSPLDFPSLGEEPTGKEFITYSAVALFAERAAAAGVEVTSQDADLRQVAAICRRLDGIPLAIELAASRVGEFGLRALRAELEGSFSILSHGRRTALERHRTLEQALEWSYGLLSLAEQNLLSRLSIFRGPFTAEAVCDLMAVEVSSRTEVGSCLSSLYAKSLVTIVKTENDVLYRLLDTTKTFAANKFSRTAEVKNLRRRHAVIISEILKQVESRWEVLDSTTWTAHYAYLIDDVREALNWSVSVEGNSTLGAILAVRSTPLWFSLSLLLEYGQWLERFLTSSGVLTQLEPEVRVRLWDSFGHAIWHTRGNMPEMADAFKKALAEALEYDFKHGQVRALWGIMISATANGQYEDAVHTLDHFKRLAQSLKETSVTLTYHRMASLSLHYAGDHAASREHAECLLRHPSNAPGRAHQTGLQFDQRVTARASLARDLFFMGYADQAMEVVAEAEALAVTIGHALSYCYVLSIAAVPIAIWRGEGERAAVLSRKLLKSSVEHSFVMWNAFARSYLGVLEARGEVGVEPVVGLLLLETIATLDETCASEIVLSRAENGFGGWSLPELLRVRARRLLAADQKAKAVEFLHRSLENARVQKALAWELRAATSLGQHHMIEGERDDAFHIIESVTSKFTEGFGTIDFLNASRLLDLLNR